MDTVISQLPTDPDRDLPLRTREAFELLMPLFVEQASHFAGLEPVLEE